MRRQQSGETLAVIYPERPRRESPTSEQQVFELLRVGLDANFVVFHSVAWHGRGQKPDGEIDFLIAHPELGILVVEVKGGGIAYDAQAGAWSTTDRNRVAHPIKDPYDQALTAKHQLIAELQADARWPHRRCQIGYAVIFPNTTVGTHGFIPRAKREITLDKGDMPTLAEGIANCLRYWREIEPERPPRRDGIKGADPDVRLVAPVPDSPSPNSSQTTSSAF
jgi:hypothetical protein